MLDLKLIREDPDAVRAALARRGGSFPIEQLLEVDALRRSAQAQLDELRAEQKKGGK
ncbi:MAG: serine--tRNA ligase, partial [Actinomycetota bacterium]